MKKSYRPNYHVTVPFGWANDPNGTVFFNGKAHLFYQHYPHKSEWGPMHWNHVTTEDFVKWEQCPVALYPDRPYELVCGCCSGSAAEKDGRLYLMYTAAQPMMQRQCIAVSDDGIHFEKYKGNPVLSADMLSPEIYEEDFRDPRIFVSGGNYYLIAGIRYLEGGKRKEAAPLNQRETTNPLQPAPEHKKEGFGNLCLLKSGDLFSWEYIGHLLYPQPELNPDFYKLEGVFECPDYFIAEDGTEVLLTSPQNLPQKGTLYQNIHSVLFMTGHLNLETGRFDVKTAGELDSGFDFYAAQTLRMPDGRVIMTAWKEMWDRSYPTRAEEWAGSYILPRELTVEGGRVVQKPVREIDNYLGESVIYKETYAENGETALPGIEGNIIRLSFSLMPGSAVRSGVKLFCGSGNETLLYYDQERKLLVFDRTNSGEKITGKESDVNVRVLEIGNPERIELEFFLDVCSIEVFVNGGIHTMTGNVYPDPEEDLGIMFYAEGGRAEFRDIKKSGVTV